MYSGSAEDYEMGEAIGAWSLFRHVPRFPWCMACRTETFRSMPRYVHL